MKKVTLLLVFAFALFASPAAKADTYYMCGCTNLTKDSPGYKNRANWVYQSAWDLAYAKQRRDSACNARFGRRAPLIGACLPAQLNGKDLANYQGRLAKRVAAARAAEARQNRSEGSRGYNRDEAIRRGSEALDYQIRRNREDEIDRVLKEARECRMYGNCPGQR